MPRGICCIPSFFCLMGRGGYMLTCGLHGIMDDKRCEKLCHRLPARHRPDRPYMVFRLVSYGILCPVRRGAAGRWRRWPAGRASGHQFLWSSGRTWCQRTGWCIPPCRRGRRFTPWPRIPWRRTPRRGICRRGPFRQGAQCRLHRPYRQLGRMADPSCHVPCSPPRSIPSPYRLLSLDTEAPSEAQVRRSARSCPSILHTLTVALIQQADNVKISW